MRRLAIVPLALLTFAAAGAPAAPSAPVPQPAVAGDVPTISVERSDSGPAANRSCDRFARVEQARDGALLRSPAPRAERLDQLPAGDVHLTVERRMDGCRQPVVIRQNVGGPAFRR